MRLKDNSINPIGMTSGLLLGLTAANEVYASHGIDMVVTSLNDATHSVTSLHYSGNAADLRILDLGSINPQTIVFEIKKRLNIHYDVILEHDHIHIEYQPRR